LPPAELPVILRAMAAATRPLVTLIGLLGAGALGLGLGAARAGVVHAPGPELAPAQPSAAPQGRGRKKKGAAPKLEPFVGTLETAKKAALEQNVPLIVHIILEGEPQNDDYRNQILPHKELIAVSQKAIVLVGNNGEHSLKTVSEEVEGRKVKSQVCSVYPTFANCAQHREPWDSIYVAYHDEAGDLRCPQTVILLPSGKQSWRHNNGDPPSAKDVVRKLREAQKAAGPGLSRAELTEIKKRVKEAGRSTDGKLWGSAWREWKGVLDIIQVGKFADQARAAQADLATKMSAQVAEIAKGLVPGRAAAAYAELTALLPELAATPAEAELKKLIKRAEKDKAIAAEIKAWKLEQEAAALLEEAIAGSEAEDNKRLRKALRKLFGKKYRETESAARGRERFPEHVPEKKEP